MSPQRKRSPRKRSARKPATAKPVVTHTPPQCPHCMCSGCTKLRGAHKVLNAPELGRVYKWFHVQCKHCKCFYILKEQHQRPAETV